MVKKRQTQKAKQGKTKGQAVRTGEEELNEVQRGEGRWEKGLQWEKGRVDKRRGGKRVRYCNTCTTVGEKRLKRCEKKVNETCVEQTK